MGIRKKDNFSSIVFYSVLAVAAAGITQKAAADSRSAARTLVASYDIPEVVTTSEAESHVADLERALADCEDGYMAFRIKYRIATVYFKAGITHRSKPIFAQIADDADCPEMVRACSFNMIGQMCRLEGKDAEALNAFDQVVALLKRPSASHRQVAADPVSAKLLRSALLGRAEICQVAGNYAAGIVEYNHLLGGPGRKKEDNLAGPAAPLVIDRMSQLYLTEGNITRYTELAEELVRDYPAYYRTPLVKLEVVCVRHLKTASNPESIEGAFAVPARVLAHIKASGDTALARRVADELEKLCKEYPSNSYAGVLLHYHYVWFLDALDDKDKAVEILKQIASVSVAGAVPEANRRKIIETIQNYARIQSAIALAEQARYREALELVGTVRTNPDGPHVSELATSVTECIQILRREVPKNEGN